MTKFRSVLAQIDHVQIAFFLIALSFSVVILSPSDAKKILLAGYVFFIPELVKAKRDTVRNLLLILLVIALCYYPLIFLYYQNQTGVEWDLYNSRNKYVYQYVLALILIFDVAWVCHPHFRKNIGMIFWVFITGAIVFTFISLSAFVINQLDQLEDTSTLFDSIFYTRKFFLKLQPNQADDLCVAIPMLAFLLANFYSKQNQTSLVKPNLVKLWGGPTILAIIYGVFLVLTGSRGGWAGVALGFGVYFIYMAFNRRWVAIIYPITMLAMVLAISAPTIIKRAGDSLTTTMQPHPGITQYEYGEDGNIICQIYDPVTKLGFGGASFGIRYDMLVEGAKIVSERPLLGFGVHDQKKMALKPYIEKRCTIAWYSHLHNHYLDTAISYGIPAAFLLFAIMAFPVVLALVFKIPGELILRMLICVYFIYIMVENLFDVTFVNKNFMWQVNINILIAAIFPQVEGLVAKFRHPETQPGKPEPH